MERSAVNEQKLTRCPGCATVFRVTAAQLALREGQVRCGHCRAVFDANDHLITLDIVAPEDFGADDELLRGRPTVTLRSADALQPAPPHASQTQDAAEPNTADKLTHDSIDKRNDDASSAGKGPTGQGTPSEATADEAAAAAESAVEESADRGAADIDRATAEGVDGEPPAGMDATTADATTTPAAVVDPDAVSEQAPAAVAPIEIRDSDRPQRVEWNQRTPIDPSRQRLYVAGIVALSLAIVVQLVAEFRDALAARIPATRPLLASACRVVSCTIEPLKDTAALSIDASDLQADPAHRGLLILSATIRNRASHPIAYPYLELTLTDSSERIVVRRAFAPQDYAGGTADFQRGIAANGERLVKLFIDASATQQAGYQLYLFYP